MYLFIHSLFPAEEDHEMSQKWGSANNEEDTGGVKHMYLRWKDEQWVNKYINKLLCNGIFR